MAQSTTRERAYRTRSYASARQRRVLGRLFGASRFVSSGSLARRTSAYQTDQTGLNWAALQQEFTGLRQAPETHWLCELPREPFNQVLRAIGESLRHAGAQGVVLGCTELGLLLGGGDVSVPVFDTARLNALAVVDAALSETE